MVYNSAGLNRTITDAGSMSAGTAYHICGVMTSSSASELFVNGVSVGTAAGRTTTNQDRVIIGATMASGTAASHIDADVADVAIWNVALTAADIAQLADNVSPIFVKPQNLVFYAPLIRDLTEWRSGISLTASGSTASAHPRIYQ
jgi:hypothetical protein